MNNDERAVLTKSQRINYWNPQKLYYSIAKKHQRNWTLKRGEVYFVDLGENIGSEENKIRPIVVIQSNSYNFTSPVFIGAIISTSPLTINDIQVPITNHYAYIDNEGNNKNLTGAIDLGQIKTIAKERIVSKKICKLQNEIENIDLKLSKVLGFNLLINKKDNQIKSLSGKVDYLKKQIDDLKK